MEMNWLLVVVFIVFGLFLVYGWCKGLLRILFSLIAVVVLMMLVSFMTPTISTFLKEHTQIYSSIQEQCEKEIYSHMKESESESLPAGLSLPQKLSAVLTETSGEVLPDKDVYESFGAKAADLVLSGMAYFAALVMSIVLVKLIDKALGVANHIPILKGFNRVFGLAAGAVEAYVLVSLFFLFVALLVAMGDGEGLIKCVDDSRFLSFLYYRNVLQNFLL